MQDINLNQLKLDLHDTCKKDEKLTTNFEASNPEDVINKAYQDEKISERNGHLLLLEKLYNEFKLLSNDQSIDEILIQSAVNTV